MEPQVQRILDVLKSRPDTAYLLIVLCEAVLDLYRRESLTVEQINTIHSESMGVTDELKKLRNSYSELTYLAKVRAKDDGHN